MAKKQRRVAARTPQRDAKRDALSGATQRHGKTDVASENLPNRDVSIESNEREPSISSGADIQPRGIALGLLSGLLVYLCYVPSDSVAVEKGEALWVTVLALAIACISFGMLRHPSALARRRIDVVIDVLPWLMATWVMFAAFNLSPPGNLRMATNEAWLWIAGAALFTSARRLMTSVDARRGILVLILACASGLAVHGLHQHFVSLPLNRTQYQNDPEWVLQQAGINAPEGSTERMVFENRLNDGGATATFSLANSLAAVLLTGMVGTLGVLWFGIGLRSTAMRWGWFLSAALVTASFCGACLLATASRSAILASLIGIACVALFAKAGRSFLPLIGLGLAAGLLVIGILSVGNAEWIDQAPASLSFRFQYWRSTLQLALQNPWFGAGPGNFQSVYERFREDSAHETIADPHNLFFETLATGGFVNAILLVILGLLIARNAADRLARTDACVARGESCRWIWLGGILSLVAVWFISLSTGVLPDIEAHLVAVPTSIAVAFLLWPTIRSFAPRELDVVTCGCVLGLVIHLMAAGGWTVPGVAIHLWLFAAMLTRLDAQPVAEATPDSEQRSGLKKDATGEAVAGRAVSITAAGVMVALIGCLYFVSIVPVQQSRAALREANHARQRGRLQIIRERLDQAANSDPWSVDAMIQKADLLRWALVTGAPDRRTESDWESAIASTKRLAGENPSVYEILGQQQLHVYQRHGRERDLRSAHVTFRSAAEWARANEGIHAQLALIESELGHPDEAIKAGRRASELASAGGVYERILDKQRIAVAEPIGKSVQRQLRMTFAGELIRQLLSEANDEKRR